MVTRNLRTTLPDFLATNLVTPELTFETPLRWKTLTTSPTSWFETLQWKWSGGRADPKLNAFWKTNKQKAWKNSLIQRKPRAHNMSKRLQVRWMNEKQNTFAIKKWNSFNKPGWFRRLQLLEEAFQFLWEEDEPELWSWCRPTWQREPELNPHWRPPVSM